jgi:archaemetzincin
LKPEHEKIIAFVLLGDSAFYNDSSPAITSASVYGLKAHVTPGAFEPSQDGYDMKRRQWDASILVKQLKELKVNGGYDFIVGITDNDMFVRGTNFVFGYAEPESGSAVISLRRLRENADSKKLTERIYKELTHEIGHLLGLKHCNNEGCIMKFANNVEEVDSKLPVLCSDCSSKVKHLTEHL